MKGPRCQETLVQVVAFGVEVDRCTLCDGTWLDRGECERASRPTGRFVKTVRRADDAPAVVDVAVDARVTCPRCGKSCFRERYSSSSVEIDRCACGVRLDRGELEKIFAHRQSKIDSIGGMRLGTAERAELERTYARSYLDLENQSYLFLARALALFPFRTKKDHRWNGGNGGRPKSEVIPPAGTRTPDDLGRTELRFPPLLL